MYINIKEKINVPLGLQLMVVNPATGICYDHVFACDTDEKWFAQYAINPETGKIFVGKQGLVTEKYHIDYDLVESGTGIVIEEVRQ